LVQLPEVDRGVELDADLFAAFGVAEALNDLGFGAGAGPTLIASASSSDATIGSLVIFLRCSSLPVAPQLG
jgi:hypothetical protein